MVDLPYPFQKILKNSIPTHMIGQISPLLPQYLMLLKLFFPRLVCKCNVNILCPGWRTASSRYTIYLTSAFAFNLYRSKACLSLFASYVVTCWSMNVAYEFSHVCKVTATTTAAAATSLLLAAQDLNSGSCKIIDCHCHTIVGLIILSVG